MGSWALPFSWSGEAVAQALRSTAHTSPWTTAACRRRGHIPALPAQGTRCREPEIVWSEAGHGYCPLMKMHLFYDLLQESWAFHGWMIQGLGLAFHSWHWWEPFYWLEHAVMKPRRRLPRPYSLRSLCCCARPSCSWRSSRSSFAGVRSGRRWQESRKHRVYCLRCSSRTSRPQRHNPLPRRSYAPLVN